MKRYRRKRWKSVDSTHIFIQFSSELQCCTNDISVVPQDISVKATHRGTATADVGSLHRRRGICGHFVNYVGEMDLPGKNSNWLCHISVEKCQFIWTFPQNNPLGKGWIIPPRHGWIQHRVYVQCSVVLIFFSQNHNLQHWMRFNLTAFGYCP